MTSSHVHHYYLLFRLHQQLPSINCSPDSLVCSETGTHYTSLVILKLPVYPRWARTEGVTAMPRSYYITKSVFITLVSAPGKQKQSDLRAQGLSGLHSELRASWGGVCGSQRQLADTNLVFHPVGPRDRTRVVRLSSKHPPPTGAGPFPLWALPFQLSQNRQSST